jgi:hypothetical protein
MDFLHQVDIKEKYGIECDISHRTACRYLQALGYRYQSTPKGLYVDGHEREDVITYWEKVFLPKWKKFIERMAAWDKDLKEHLPTAATGREKRVIAWFYDESVFYAHDRQKQGWFHIHKDASAKPYAKGEGASLMIAILFQRTLAGSVHLIDNNQRNNSLNLEKTRTDISQMKTSSSKRTRQLTSSKNIILILNMCSSMTMRLLTSSALRMLYLPERCQKAFLNLGQIGVLRYPSAI